MGNIADYQKVSTVEGTDTLLMETENGTRGILASILSKRMLELIDIHGYCGMMNNVAKNNPAISEIIRRNVWRGSNLGTSITAAQWNAIANQTFDNMFCGDYWILNNKIYRIMDFNYWMNTGDIRCITPHVVLMLDKADLFWNTTMNDTKESKPYAISDLRDEQFDPSIGNDVTAIINIVAADIGGRNHYLSHREVFQSISHNNHSSGSMWYDSLIEVPSERMLTGCTSHSPSGDGSEIIDNDTNSSTQLAAFRLNNSLIISSDKQNYWLRDYIGGNMPTGPAFTLVNKYGSVSYNAATTLHGNRPVFGICKENIDSTGGVVA